MRTIDRVANISIVDTAVTATIKAACFYRQLFLLELCTEMEQFLFCSLIIRS